MHGLSFFAEVEQHRIWLNLVIAFAIALGTRALLGLLLRMLPHQQQQSLSHLRPALWQALLLSFQEKTHPVAIWSLGAWLALPYWTVSQALWPYVALWFWLIGTLQVGLWSGNFLQRLIWHVWQPSSTDQGWRATKQLLNTLGHGLIWFLLLSTALNQFGVHMWPLLTTFGLTGALLVLATQNIASDIFASFSLLIDRPFVVGDLIRFDQLTGRVERIGLKSTRLRSPQGEEISISNAELLKRQVSNISRHQERRFVHAFPLSWQTPAATLQRLPDLLANELKDQTDVRFDRATYGTLQEGQLVLEVVYVALGGELGKYPHIQHRVLLKLLRIFHRENITIQTLPR